MPPPPKHGRLLFPSLIAISFVGPLSIHLFLPGMSAVKAEFGVSTGMAQLTLSLVMFVMAGTTLVYGALSDRLGRRKVLLAGLALFTLGAALSSVAPDIWTLLAGRTLQGLGAGCGVVLARAIARDIYGLERLPQIIAWLTAAYVTGPLVAPPLGGFLTDTLGWRSPLIVAAVLGAALLALVATVVNETLAGRPASQPGMFRGSSAPRFSSTPPQDCFWRQRCCTARPANTGCGSSYFRLVTWRGTSSRDASGRGRRSSS